MQILVGFWNLIWENNSCNTVFQLIKNIAILIKMNRKHFEKLDDLYLISTHIFF